VGTQVHQRAAQAEWRVSNACVHVMPVVGDAVELTGASAAVWAVLDRPRTEAEVFAEALQIDPLLDRDEVASALRELVSRSLVWCDDPGAARRDIAI
jgi:phosphoglycolate phosphatase-like HAD superfamily hydrolase